MAKNSISRNSISINYEVFILDLIASLIYIVITFGSVYGTGLSAATNFAGIWVPLLFGIAVIGSISLFVISLSTLVIKKGYHMLARATTNTTTVTAFALIILTTTVNGSMLPFIGVVIAFILGIVAGAAGALKK